MTKKIVSKITFWFNWLGQWPLMTIMAIIIVMIFMRLLLIPMAGFYELIVILAFFLYIAAWPYTGMEKRHIRVLILLERFPPRVRSSFNDITSLLSLGTCVVMVWASIIYGHQVQDAGRILSESVPFPRYFFSYLMALGFLLYGMVIYLDLLDSLTSLRGKR